MKYLFMGIIVPYSAVIPISVAIARYRALAVKYKVILLYLCFTLAANIAARILASNHITNLPLLHADTVIEMILFSVFFIHSFQHGQGKTIVRILILLFAVFAVINFTFFQSLYQFNTYTRPVEAIIIIAFCLWYWWSPAKKEDEERYWGQVADNWFVSGILLYFSSALFLFIFSNYLYGQFSIAANKFVWNLHGAIVIVMNLLFTIGFIKCKK